jgi:hypothetical protein
MKSLKTIELIHGGTVASVRWAHRLQRRRSRSSFAVAALQVARSRFNGVALVSRTFGGQPKTDYSLQFTLSRGRNAS